MTTKQLKPCPFCAAEAELVGDRIYARHFQFCILYAQVVYDFKRTMWNTRPIEDSLRAKLKIAVEALEAIAKESNCECWDVPGMGSGLDYKWIGCREHRSQDKMEWCLCCKAHEALSKIRGCE